jgi:L-ascorbate metabolism protein UlaG (beta-lactamase superfamily)
MTGHSSDITYFRWLGTAGIEIHFKNKILLIDPYLTREPIKKILFGNLESNKALIKDLIPKADYILITHSHFDHLCDVPTIMSNTDSIAAGSQNTFKILKAAGITDDKFIQIDIEKTVLWPEITIASNPIVHMKVPGYGSGEIKNIATYPIKSGAYKMDIDYQYKITIGDIVFLTDIGKANTLETKCDVLFLYPFYTEKYIHQVLERIETKNIVFLHWDNFMKPLVYEDGKLILPKDNFVTRTRKSKMLSMKESIKKRFDKKINVVIPEFNKLYEFGEGKYLA